MFTRKLAESRFEAEREYAAAVVADREGCRIGRVADEAAFAAGDVAAVGIEGTLKLS